MAKLISECPVCGGSIKIKSLQCCSCGMELRNDFDLSIFDRLNEEQYRFLLTFLKARGNLKLLQEEMNISYPYAKKKLTELLLALGLNQAEDTPLQQEDTEMLNIFRKTKSNKASDIIKAKLAENGGSAVVVSLSGMKYEIKADSDGCHILCDVLPPVYTYDVFDVIVELLKKQPDFTARKGNARNYRLGEPGCAEDSVAGVILKEYFNKVPGESGLDPVFILAAILEWAGIAHNMRGKLKLTAAYREGL